MIALYGDIFGRNYEKSGKFTVIAIAIGTCIGIGITIGIGIGIVNVVVILEIWTLVDF